MLTAMSAGSVGKEKSTTMIELHCSNKGPGGFSSCPFLFVLFSWNMGVGLLGNGLFYAKKE